MEKRFTNTRLDKIKPIVMITILSIGAFIFGVLPILYSLSRIIYLLIQGTFNDSGYDSELFGVFFMGLLISIPFAIGIYHYYKQIRIRNDSEITLDNSNLQFKGNGQYKTIQIGEIKEIQIINYYVSNKNHQPYLYSKYGKATMFYGVDIIIVLNKGDNLEINNLEWGFSKRQVYGFYKFLKKVYKNTIEFRDPSFFAIEKV